jgi:hypothetical protein
MARILDLVAGNPFSRNIFETRDKKWAVLSAVYVDLAYQRTAFLDCSMTESGVREATKKYDAAGYRYLSVVAWVKLLVVRNSYGFFVLLCRLYAQLFYN